jgi:hypothetical protein
MSCHYMRKSKMQLAAGICAVKASRHVPGLLCERFHDLDNIEIFILAFRYATDANSAFKRFYCTYACRLIIQMLFSGQRV